MYVAMYAVRTFITAHTSITTLKTAIVVYFFSWTVNQSRFASTTIQAVVIILNSARVSGKFECLCTDSGQS